MEQHIYETADYGIGIFVLIVIAIVRFIIKQGQKGNQQNRGPVPNFSSQQRAPQQNTEYASSQEDAIAQILGEYRAKDKVERKAMVSEIVEEPEEVEEEEAEFERDEHYKIKKVRKSKASQFLDTPEELRHAIIAQEILGKPVSKR